MQPTKYIWQNGRFKKWKKATVHVLAHTLHYGTGTYEGLRVYATPSGSKIFKLEEHVKRLVYSASVIDMTLDYSVAEICDIITQVVKKNRLKEGYIRPLCYYGSKNMGVSASGNPVELMVACWPWGKYLTHDRVNIKTSRYIRIHPQSTDVNAKLCGHYVNSLLAALELKNSDFDEMLLLDVNGHVAEGPGENIFIVKDKVLYTPRLGYILPGITRSTVIELARAEGYRVIEQDLTEQAIFDADEAFFTGTAVEITAIRSLNNQLIGEDKMGSVTQHIKEKYYQLVRNG